MSTPITREQVVAKIDRGAGTQDWIDAGLPTESGRQTSAGGGR